MTMNFNSDEGNASSRQFHSTASREGNADDVCIPPDMIQQPRTPGEKPKRMLNAYNFFFSHYHRNLQERIRRKEEAGNPDVFAEKQELKDLAKTIAAKWKNATDEEKNFYQKLSDQDRIRHEREMAEWMQELAQQNEALLRMPVASDGHSTRPHSQRSPRSQSTQQSMTHIQTQETPRFAVPTSAAMLPPSPFQPHRQQFQSRAAPVGSQQQFCTTGNALTNPAAISRMRMSTIASPFATQPSQYRQTVTTNLVLPPPPSSSTTTSDALVERSRIRRLAQELGEDGVDAVIRIFGGSSG